MVEQILSYINAYIPGWLITTVKVIICFVLIIFAIEIARLILHVLMKLVGGILNIFLRIIKEVFPYVLGIGVVGYLGRYVWRRYSLGDRLLDIHVDVHSIWGWFQESGIITFVGYSLLVLVGGFLIYRFFHHFVRFGWFDFLTTDLRMGSSGSSKSYESDDNECPSYMEQSRAREEKAFRERRHQEKLIDAMRERQECQRAMYEHENDENDYEYRRRTEEAEQRENSLRSESDW